MNVRWVGRSDNVSVLFARWGVVDGLVHLEYGGPTLESVVVLWSVEIVSHLTTMMASFKHGCHIVGGGSMVVESAFDLARLKAGERVKLGGVFMGDVVSGMVFRYFGYSQFDNAASVVANGFRVVVM